MHGVEPDWPRSGRLAAAAWAVLTPLAGIIDQIKAGDLNIASEVIQLPSLTGFFFPTSLSCNGNPLFLVVIVRGGGRGAPLHSLW